MARFSTILCKQFLIVFLGFAGHVKLNDRNSRGDEFMWMEGLGKFGACLATKACIHYLCQQPDFPERSVNIHGLCQVHLPAFRQLVTSVHHSCGIGQSSPSLVSICKWHMFIHSSFSIFLHSPPNQAITFSSG